MKTVNIGELKNQLSAYLQYVRSGEGGEEMVVRDHSVPVARVLPFHGTSASDEEAKPVASGAMKLPEQKVNWNSFFSRPKGNVSSKAAVEAAVESRGDR